MECLQETDAFSAYPWFQGYLTRFVFFVVPADDPCKIKGYLSLAESRVAHLLSRYCSPLGPEESDPSRCALLRRMLNGIEVTKTTLAFDHDAFSKKLSCNLSVVHKHLSLTIADNFEGTFVVPLLEEFFQLNVMAVNKPLNPRWNIQRLQDKNSILDLFCYAMMQDLPTYLFRTRQSPLRDPDDCVLVESVQALVGQSGAPGCANMLCDMILGSVGVVGATDNVDIRRRYWYLLVWLPSLMIRLCERCRLTPIGDRDLLRDFFAWGATQKDTAVSRGGILWCEVTSWAE